MLDLNKVSEIIFTTMKTLGREKYGVFYSMYKDPLQYAGKKGSMFYNTSEFTLTLVKDILESYYEVIKGLKQADPQNAMTFYYGYKGQQSLNDRTGQFINTPSTAIVKAVAEKISLPGYSVNEKMYIVMPVILMLRYVTRDLQSSSVLRWLSQNGIGDTGQRAFPKLDKIYLNPTLADLNQFTTTTVVTTAGDKQSQGNLIPLALLYYVFTNL